MVVGRLEETIARELESRAAEMAHDQRHQRMRDIAAMHGPVAQDQLCWGAIQRAAGEGQHLVAHGFFKADLAFTNAWKAALGIRHHTKKERLMRSQ